jgi:hypothetical protein
MASGVRMLVAGIMLVTNTIILMMFALSGGAIFGPIYSWFSQQQMTNPVIKPWIVQWFPGLFFGFLLVLEIILIFTLWLQVASVQTRYPEY